MFPLARPKELLRKEKGWLTDVGHNSWWHMKCAQHAAHNPKFEKTFPVVTIKRLKDPPTWLKVATTLEKPPTPTHLKNKLQRNPIQNSDIFIQENTFQNIAYKIEAILSWP